MGEFNLVLGIGINANLDLDDLGEYKDKATSLKLVLNKDIDREKLIGHILNEFESLYLEFLDKKSLSHILDVLKETSSLLGKDIRLIRGEKIDYGKALDINEEGQLVVKREDGTIENLYYGEVSIRLRDS